MENKEIDKSAKYAFLPLKKCICCGEERYVACWSDYAWKFHGKFCCSYSCMRKMQKQEQASPEYQRKYRNDGVTK